MSAATLPNFLVIGAMKCGTSSLHHYLGLHPEIGMSADKELNFFLPDAATILPGGEAELPLLEERSTHAKGLDWYAQQFPAAPMRGESSTAYSLPWYPEVAEIVAATLPGTRLIYLVRDPLERMHSHLSQFRGRDPRSPAEAFSAPGNPYLGASRYASCLEPFLEHFARDHVQIVNADHLRERRRETMASVFSFLGVDPAFYSDEFEHQRNRTAAKTRSYRLLERLSTGPLAGVAERLPRAVRARTERTLSDPEAETTRPALDASVAIGALEALEHETEALEALTGWDLASWRRIT